MKRAEFHKFFKSPGPVVLPVIHVLDNDQARRNARLAIECGAPGLFLINHDFEVERFLPIIRHVRSQFPALWMGVNFLAVTGRDAFPVLAELQSEGVQVDAYWGDDARIDESADFEDQTEANKICATRASSGWNGLYFGGTAFKKQREVDPADYAAAAVQACRQMEVVTTSGVATGHSADLDKIATFRAACCDHPLALASGVTPENAAQYANDVDAFLVATGVSDDGDFYNLNARKLRQLLNFTHQFGGNSEQP